MHFRGMWLPRAVLRIAGQEAGKLGRRPKFEDYEEIADRVFEIVLRKSPRDLEASAYRGWICRTIVYVSRNQLRRNAPIPFDVKIVESLLNRMNCGSRSGLDAAQLEKIEEAVGRLPHNQR